jgi:hypothetical protein
LLVFPLASLIREAGCLEADAILAGDKRYDNPEK